MPEGYFSLNDKIGDIMKTMKGKLLFMGMFAKTLPKKGDKVAGNFEMNDSMLGMLGGFTVLRLSGMIGAMGINLTKEDLLDLNAKLNKIKKGRF
jgi:beta-galactosidase